MAEHKDLERKTEEVARENVVTTGNGNRGKVSDTPGGAEKGGPDFDKAQDRQPPGATRTDERVDEYSSDK